MAGSTSSEPLSLAEIGDRVARRIDAVLEAEAARWTEVDVSLAEPIEALRSFVAAGGKRLRPAFCHWGFVAAGGGPESTTTVDAGSAIELLHACALLHDDVMDASSLRRGQPTLHMRFADDHRRRQWRGESRRFGEGAAILIGDLAFVYADRLLRAAPQAALDVFVDLRLEVNFGQYLDLRATATGEASEQVARAICVYKSGKYTVERPLHLGAALLGPDALARVAEPLSRYGLPLGEAFQLRDDLLGAFGDDAIVGKHVGEDFREGKPTALYAIARDRASGAAASLLAERFGQADLTEGEVSAIQEVFTATGARAAVERRAETLADQALTALAGAGLPERARDELELLAAFIVGRDR